MTIIESTARSSLVWPADGRALVRIDLSGLTHKELVASRYEIMLGDRPVGFLLKSGAGYRGDPLSLDPRVLALGPSIALGLEAHGQADLPALVVAVRLWEDEDISVFDASGRLLDSSSRLDFAATYSLVVRSDLAVLPANRTTLRGLNAAWIFVRLEGGRSEETRLLDQTDPIWESGEPARGHAPVPRPKIFWQWREIRLGTPYQFDVSVEPPWAIVAVECRGRRFVPSPMARTKLVVGPVELPVDAPPRAVAFRVFVEAGSTTSEISRRVPCWLLGIALRDEHGVWQAFGPDDVLDIGAVRPSEVFVVARRREAEGGLFIEGDKDHGAIEGSRGRFLPTFLGLGSRLAVGWPQKSTPSRLVKSVIDTGDLASASQGDDGAIGFELRRPVEGVPFALVLDILGGVHVAECEAVGDRRLRAKMPRAKRMVAAGIGVDGRRMGATWTGDWTRALAADNLTVLAPVVRWLRLPIFTELAKLRSREGFAAAFIDGKVSIESRELACDELDLAILIALRGSEWQRTRGEAGPIKQAKQYDVRTLDVTEYGTSWSGRTSLYEGERLIRMNAQRVAPVRGLGESLRLLAGESTSKPDREVIVAKRLVDAGLLDGCSIDAGDRGAHILIPGAPELLTGPPEAVGFTRDGIFRSRLKGAGDGAFFLDVGGVVAFGVVRGSERLGAWWRDDWLSVIFNAPPAAARLMLPLVRFLRLPVAAAQLNATHVTFAKIARRFPGPVLDAYLIGGAVAGETGFDALAITNLPAASLELELLRDLVRDWEEGDDESFEWLVDALIAKHADPASDYPQLVACELIARFDPRVAARAFRGWLSCLPLAPEKKIAIAVRTALAAAGTPNEAAKTAHDLRSMGMPPYRGIFADAEASQRSIVSKAAAMSGERAAANSTYDALVRATNEGARMLELPAPLESPGVRAMVLALLLRDAAATFSAKEAG